jgi:hypothetical protein
MKSKFKLNSEAPEQSMAILAIAGVMILISVITSLGGRSKDATGQEKGPNLEAGETLYKNPQMAWYEKYLCRGYQRSSFCSFRLLHPFTEVFDDNGIEVKAGRPEKNGIVNCQEGDMGCITTNPYANGPESARGVIRYRGPVPGSRSLSGKVVLNYD